MVRISIWDLGTICLLSMLINDYLGINDVYLSIPAVVNSQGIKFFMRMELNKKKHDQEIGNIESDLKEAEKRLEDITDAVRPYIPKDNS